MFFLSGLQYLEGNFNNVMNEYLICNLFGPFVIQAKDTFKFSSLLINASQAFKMQRYFWILIFNILTGTDDLLD